MVRLLGKTFLACLNKVAVRFLSRNSSTCFLVMLGYFFRTAAIKASALEYEPGFLGSVYILFIFSIWMDGRSDPLKEVHAFQNQAGMGQQVVWLSHHSAELS